MINKLSLYDVSKLLMVKPLLVITKQNVTDTITFEFEIEPYIVDWIKEWEDNMNSIIASLYKRELIFEVNNYSIKHIGCFIRDKTIDLKRNRCIVDIHYDYNEYNTDRTIIQIIRNNNIDKLIE